MNKKAVYEPLLGPGLLAKQHPCIFLSVLLLTEASERGGGETMNVPVKSQKGMRGGGDTCRPSGSACLRPLSSQMNASRALQCVFVFSRTSALSKLPQIPAHHPAKPGQQRPVHPPLHGKLFHVWHHFRVLAQSGNSCISNGPSSAGLTDRALFNVASAVRESKPLNTNPDAAQSSGSEEFMLSGLQSAAKGFLFCFSQEIHFLFILIIAMYSLLLMYSLELQADQMKKVIILEMYLQYSHFNLIFSINCLVCKS